MDKNDNCLYFIKSSKNIKPSCQFQKQDQIQIEKNDKSFEKSPDFEFEKKVQKIFMENKFVIGNAYDHDGSEKFLKDKDECMKNMFLNDEIEEKSSRKKSRFNKNFKRIFKSTDKRTSKIKQKRNQRESFFSIGGSGYLDDVMNLL